MQLIIEEWRGVVQTEGKECPAVGGRTAMAGMGKQCIVMVWSKGQDLAGLQRQWEQLTPRATGSLWKELFRRLGGGRRMTGVCLCWKKTTLD